MNSAVYFCKNQQIQDVMVEKTKNTRNIKEETKTNKRQCPVSLFRVPRSLKAVQIIVREYVFYVFLKIQKKRDFLRFFEVSCQKNVKKRRKRCPSFHFLHFEIANEHFYCKTITHIVHMSCYTYNIILKLFIFG